MAMARRMPPRMLAEARSSKEASDPADVLLRAVVAAQAILTARTVPGGR